jgi:hypothetical protein
VEPLANSVSGVSSRIRILNTATNTANQPVTVLLTSVFVRCLPSWSVKNGQHRFRCEAALPQQATHAAFMRSPLNDLGG